jgi:hypothetical protein
VVKGRWAGRTYTADGKERRKLEVVVEDIGPSLHCTETTAKPNLQAVPDIPSRRSSSRAAPAPEGGNRAPAKS